MRFKQILSTMFKQILYLNPFQKQYYLCNCVYKHNTEIQSKALYYL